MIELYTVVESEMTYIADNTLIARHTQIINILYHQFAFPMTSLLPPCSCPTTLLSGGISQGQP